MAAQTILKLVSNVNPKAQDDSTESKSLETARCLAEAAADITSEAPKITPENANDDALDSARVSVINADMTISATIEKCDDSETRERLSSIAGCLQRNVRKIKKGGSENKNAANGIVIAAIRLSGEAAKMTGKEGAAGAVSATTAAAVRIAGLAAGIAAHASGIVLKTEGAAAEHATRIVTDAAKVAEEAANVPTQGDNDDISHNVRVAAEISKKTTVLEDGAAKVAEEVGTQFEDPLHKIDGDIQQIKKEAASIAAESAAGLLAKLAGDVGQSTLLGALPLGLFGKDIVNRIFAEVFKLLVDPNVALKTAGDMFKSAEDQADALRYIIKERSQLAEFLIDLIEPAREFAVSTSSDGTPRGSNARELNEYNELNLHKPMNRYAVICQLQRLVKSIVILFDNRKEEGNSGKLEMNTTLDADTAGYIVKSDAEGAEFQKGKEEWFFVNGISREPFWVKAVCNRIAEVFQREVTGILNRSEGLFWDMLECAGDQNTSGDGSNLVDSTESSRRAQKTLKEKLQASSAQQSRSELQKDNQDLLQRLRVFTFSNPSRDWDFDLGHAEHYHNEKDFVANIGVGRKGASDAYKGTIFTNSTWKGHLFNAQHSLNAKHYGVDRDGSKLLACTDGSNPQALAVKQPKPKAKPEPQADETPERKPKPQPKPKAEPESESESESEEEPEPEPERNPKPKPKPKAQPQAQASPARRPKREPASEESPATTPEY
ncbi:hypothetical protein BJX62DRAFT_241525 [Aspergillus germanicus]